MPPDIAPQGPNPVKMAMFEAHYAQPHIHRLAVSSVIGSSSVQVEARNSTLASRSDDHLRLHRFDQQKSTTKADAIVLGRRL